MPKDKNAVIIGSGFGGLALAIRLQSAGIKTTIVEARDKPGGRAYYFEQNGFTFDAGPTVITDPDCLQQLWALTGHKMEDDVELLPISPFYRLLWNDGKTFDYFQETSKLHKEIHKLNPADVDGYEEFLHYSEQVYEEGYLKLGAKAFLSFSDMMAAAPSLAKYQAWRSVYSIVSKYVEDEHLRQALSFHSLLIGGNPMKASSIYTLIHALERKGGVWYAKGGTNRMIAAMVTHFERLGGVVRLDDAVTKIDTLGNQVTAVHTKSGWTQKVDLVASNADIMHSYRDLLGDNPRGKKYAQKLRKKSFSPSLFVLHLGLKGTFDNIEHHSILFGNRYKSLLDDIFEHGVINSDFSLYLHHPSATDPSVAPEGHSTLYALVPVPHLGKFPNDWSSLEQTMEDWILDKLEKLSRYSRTNSRKTPLYAG